MPDTIAGQHGYTIISGFDIYSPEKMAKLFARYGDQGETLLMMYKALGWEEPVAQDEYSSYEENWRHESVTVRSNVSDPGAGNTADVTLATTDLGDNNEFYVKQWDNLTLPNEVVVVVTDVDITTPADPVITIKPVVSTDNIGALSAGTELAITSNSHSEGSGQPDGDVTGVYENENQTQIIKTSIGVTGSELTRQQYVNIYDGKRYLGLYFINKQIGIDFRHNLKMSGALLTGKKNTATIADSTSGYNVKLTEGLIPYIRRVGNEYPKTVGNFAISDFDAIDKILCKNYAAQSVLFGMGINRHQEVENKLKDYFDNTNITYAIESQTERLFGNNPALAASVNFTSFLKSGRLYNFKRLGELHNPKTYGIDGYGYEDMAIVIPLATVPDPKNEGKKVSTVGFRYKKLGSYSRRLEVWSNGTAGNQIRIGDIDANNTYMRSEIGGHFIMGNQMVLVHG